MHRFGLGPDHSDPSAVCVHILKKPESARPTSSHLYSRRASNVTRSRDDSYDTDYIAREFPFARQSDSKNPYNRKYFRPRYKLIPSGKKQRDNAVTNAAQGILLPTRSNFRTTPKVRKSPESSARCLSEEDPVKKTRKKISSLVHRTQSLRLAGVPRRAARQTHLKFFRSTGSRESAPYYSRGVVHIQEAVVFRCF